MATMLKCKMCGGDIEVTADLTVGKCLYCGSTMTLPRIDSDRKARLFNRANEYRLNNEFDKAYEAYEAIAEEDEQEAEAYWGMVLSEYGVEYVEDPKTGKRVPTCHRTQSQSVLENTNTKLAQKYSSGEQRLLYKDEAETLDKLQRQIIAVSSRLDPYDVFICYKETDDASGERTKDSLIAESIYEELEKQQIRAFYARVSLEEHLGENYEPYIYAALKSARVMIVVSTKAEYTEAVWVRNEWLRFLAFMNDDTGKVLIPVYKDISPYDLPRQLSALQSQDMSKIGAVQDLARGIKKILGTTRTETRDAKLDALVADQQRREAQHRGMKRAILITVPAFIIIGIAVFFYHSPAGLYKRAESMANKGDYEGAVQMYREAGDYKDSTELSNRYETLSKKKKAVDRYIDSCYVGGKLEGYGSYRDASLNWTCIAVDGNVAVFLADEGVTNYIGNTFFGSTKYDIIVNFVSGEDFGLIEGNRVDELREEEVRRYLPSEESRICRLNGKDTLTPWHLKNVEYENIPYVDTEGRIQSFVRGTDKYTPSMVYRPAMWLNMKIAD